MRKEFKPVNYKGKKIVFVTVASNRVWAKVPSITRQYLGFGKNKTEALAEAKRNVDHLLKVKKRGRRK